MPFEIQVENEDAALRVTHNGSVNLAELNDARAQSRIVMDATGFTRIFVDATKVANTLGMTEHFVFNAGHQKEFPSDVKIAIVFDAESFDYNKYVEKCADSMGTNLRAFVDRDKARQWLLK